MSEEGGRKATKSGQRLEKFIANLISDGEYTLVPKAQFDRLKGQGKPIYCVQYEIGEDIYGKSRKVDFMLYHPERWKECLVIEAKWQQTSGTVDEKFPFLRENIKLAGYSTMIVLDGGGYTTGAEKWLRERVGSDCLVRVMNMSEFQKFVNDGDL